MEKRVVIEILEKGHKDFKKVIGELDSETLDSVQAIGKWPVRDVLAHITAWYLEFIREIDSFLIDKPIINLPSGDDAFNQREVRLRKDKKLEELLKEWEDSYKALIGKVESLSEDEWNHICTGHFWPDTKEEVGVQSLFATYQDSGTSHEGEHAREIKNFFDLCVTMKLVFKLASGISFLT